MPFTFSHPALVIPFLHARTRYKWLSTTGLIVGSIAPDFEKFLRLKLASSHSHTLASVFYFSCPVSIALAFLFHLVVRRHLIAHLPAVLYRRFASFSRFDWTAHFRRHYVSVLLSIVMGAMLHLFWDSFTHPNTLMATLWPMLKEKVWIGSWSAPLFQIMGLVNSAAGAVAILWAIWLMPVQPIHPPPTKAIVRYWALAVFVGLALEIEWVLVVQPRILNGGIAAISAGLIGIVVTSLYARRRALLRQRS